MGAAVLVALGVWLIPWVLDGRDPAPGTTADTDELALPSLDEPQAPLRTETVELEPEARPIAAADDAASPTGEIAVAVPVDSGSRPETPEAASDVAASGSAAAEIEQAAANAGSWSVQLGAFSEVANAEQQVARVENYGYSASVSAVVSGANTLHRVRIGGFGSEGEAEAAASSLSARGIPVRVIAPE